MLTRIYALAFTKRAELDDFVKRRKAAQEFDHKKLGEELDIFHIDDELGKAVGLEDLAELRQEIRQRMQRDYESIARQRLKRALLDKLAEGYDFPVPPGMVEMEFQTIWSQYEAEKQRQHRNREFRGQVDPQSAVAGRQHLGRDQGKACHDQAADGRPHWLGQVEEVVGPLHQMHGAHDPALTRFYQTEWDFVPDLASQVLVPAAMFSAPVVRPAPAMRLVNDPSTS